MCCFNKSYSVCIILDSIIARALSNFSLLQQTNNIHGLSNVMHSYGTFTVRNQLFCKKRGLLLTCGLSETYLAQCRMRRMASMLVSGKEALQANSDRHLTASWKESMVAAKCFSNTFAGRRIEED